MNIKIPFTKKIILCLFCVFMIFFLVYSLLPKMLVLTFCCPFDSASSDVHFFSSNTVIIVFILTDQQGL